jgi:hypothetical protein
MTERTWFETIKVESGELATELSKLIHEGNVRRISIRHAGHVVMEFPLTVGFVATLIAPMAAAIGALVALLSDCSIEVERTEPAPLAGEKLAALDGEAQLSPETVVAPGD